VLERGNCIKRVAMALRMAATTLLNSKMYLGGRYLRKRPCGGNQGHGGYLSRQFLRFLG
jgi:hypothetical protein